MPKPETIARQQSKERILRIAQKGGDWKVVADALDVNYKTAWLWVSQDRKSDLLETPPPPKLSWGGKRAEKIKGEHLDFLERLIADNCLLTLREMAEALHKEFGLKVVQQTVQKRLHCMMYSLHKSSSNSSDTTTTAAAPGHEPLSSLALQQRTRREYAVALQALEAAGKRVFYIDETSYNMWCAKRMERCRNVHVLACLSERGIALWEHMSGALKHDDTLGFVRRALDAVEHKQLTPSLADVVLVVDRSVTFASMHELSSVAKYSGVTVLQLPAQSPTLNPCERIFDTFRATAKEYLTNMIGHIRATPEGKSVIEHRSMYLMTAAEQFFPMAATPDACAASIDETRERVRALLLPTVASAAADAVATGASGTKVESGGSRQVV